MLTMTSKFTLTSKRHANFTATPTNDSENVLNNSEASVNLSLAATATSNSGYMFIQTGNILNGKLESWIFPILVSGQAVFSVGLNLPNGNNSNRLPSAYWVNGILINLDTIDTPLPFTPTGLMASAVMTLYWNASTDNIKAEHYIVSYSDKTTTRTLSSASPVITITELSPATVYTLALTLLDNNGDDSPHFTPLAVRTLVFQNTMTWGGDCLILGFITLSPDNFPCRPVQSNMPVCWAKPLADEINAAGLKIYVSSGGASNTDISTTFTVNPLVTAYANTLNSLGTSGLDFDLENGLYNIDTITQTSSYLAKTVSGNISKGLKLKYQH